MKNETPFAATARADAAVAVPAATALLRGAKLLSATLAAAALAGCVNVDDSVSPRPSEQWRPSAQERSAQNADNRKAGGKGSSLASGQDDWLAQERAAQGQGGAAATGSVRTGGYPARSATALAGMQPLDLAALVDIALENNPQTRISWFRAKAGAAGLGQAESTYYPYITLSGDLTRLHTRNVSTPGTDNTTRYGPSLNINWLLFNFGNREAQADAAREALYAANYNFNQAFQQAVRDVTVAYYNFYAAQSRVEASKAYLKNTEATEDAARKKLDSGLGNRQDYLRARAGVSTARAQLEGDYAAIEQARAALAQVLGIAVSDALQVKAPEQLGAASASLVDQDVNRLIAQAVENKPELLAAQALVRSSEADVRAARAALWPELSIGASGSYYRYSGGSYIGNPAEQYGVGLILSWDIFQGFNKKYAIEKAQSELRAQQETLRQAELAAISSVWTAYYNYRSSLRQIEATEDAVQAQQEAYDAVSKGYGSGINSLLDLLTSQQSLDTAREQAIDARANVGISLANLALAIGSLE